ncbi:MAG: metal-dependent hydrolase [Gemmatimonadales bacterium]
MDNLTHTLVGGTLAQAGLKRAAPLASATLLIGANLPDVDVLAYLFGTNLDALAFRRGWTHGILAMLVLPLLLAGAVMLLSRQARKHPGPLVGIAALAVWSHPLLDLLNVYGARLLMPFSERWFYGDALFIIDPWIWLALGLALVLTRRRSRAGEVRARVERPARAALIGVAGYAIVMGLSGRAGEAVVEAQTQRSVRRMVAPVFGNPFRREVIRDLGGRYEIGTLRLGFPPVYSPGDTAPAGWEQPGADRAAESRDGARFLKWARFPRYQPLSAGAALISDLRFSRRNGGWASVTVTTSG